MSDQHTGKKTGNDSSVNTKISGSEYEVYHRDSQNGDQDSTGVGTAAQGLQKLCLCGALSRLNQECTDHGADDTYGSQKQREGNSSRSRYGSRTGKCSVAQSTCRNNGSYIGLIKIGTHTGNVTYVITYVIGDNCRVTGIILRNTGFNLTYQVSTNVSSFGINTTADTGKQRHGRCTHSESQHSTGDSAFIHTKYNFKQQIPYGNVKKAETNYSKSHNGTCGECDAKTFVQACLTCVCSSCVSSCGNRHAHISGQSGEKSADNESYRNKPGKHAEGCHD